MGIGDRLATWPLWRQLTSEDRLGLSEAARSPVSASLAPRTDGAEVTASVCPFCAVGCGQRIYTRDNEIVHVEGDPDSPVSRGRLCARGSSTKDLVAGPGREYKVKYRRPHGTEWEELDLDTAMDMIADRVVAAREAGWEDRDADGAPLHRTMSLACLGGAALDNEENYFIKKLFTALGAIQIENQARI